MAEHTTRRGVAGYGSSSVLNLWAQNNSDEVEVARRQWSRRSREAAVRLRSVSAGYQATETSLAGTGRLGR